MGSSISTARIQTYGLGGWVPVGLGSGAQSLPVVSTGTTQSNTQSLSASDAVVPAPNPGASVTGNPTANSFASWALRGSDVSVTFTIGAMTSGTLYFEGTWDGTNWWPIWVTKQGILPGNQAPVYSVNSGNGVFQTNSAGMSQVRIRAFALTPAVSVNAFMSPALATTSVANALPPGNNTIGQVINVGSGNQTPVAGSITAAVANTPGTAVTASTTAQIVMNTALAGNISFALVASAFVGTVIFEVSVDAGFNYSPIMCIREDGTGSETSAAISAAATFIRIYTTGLAGLSYMRIRCSSYTSGTLAVVMQSGPSLLEPNPSLAASAANIGNVGLTSPNASALGIYANVNPYGTMRVTVEPSTLLMDPFDGAVIDVNRWVASGTQAPTQSNGAMTFAPTVGASVANNALLVSIPTFVSPGLSFLTLSKVVTLEAAQTNAVNVHRFWGKGQVTSFAYATPITDGVGFEVEGTSGALQCVVYINGTKYVVNSSTVANISSSLNGAVPGGTPAGTAFPTGAVGTAYGKALSWMGGAHRYAVMMRSDVIYWFIEGTEVPVAALSYVTPNVQGLPLRMHSITNGAATSLANTFLVGAVAASDNSAQNHTISDPTYQHRRVGVSPANHMKVAPYSSTPGQTSPSMSTTSGAVLAANASRVGATLINDPNSASSVYVLLGATASATAYTVILAPGAYYEVPFGYAGAIAGICTSGTATMRVTELTP